MPSHITRVRRLARFMHDTYERAAREAGWETQQLSRVPWGKIPKANKATMLRLAEEVLFVAPVRCPVYQCGGFMKCGERPCPADDPDQFDHWDGDEQTPDLVCENCKAVYQFTGFKKRRARPRRE